MSKTVVITGGAGYVGRRVAEALFARGFDAVIVDVHPPKENLSPGIEFRRADLRVPAEAYKAIRGADVVLHLAADIGSLTYMHNHQADILSNNMLIDSALYPALVAQRVPWVVYSSSSMVFQYPPKFPYTEDDISDIKVPSNVYGFAKLAGEYFCRSYAAQHDLNYTIIRYHNIYGPGEDSKGSSPGDIHVVPALLQKVLGGQYPLELMGDPEATRPFTFVDDAVDATVEIVRRALQGDETVRNESFNISHHAHYSILELAKIIWRNFGDGRAFAYRVVPTAANTALRREVDLSKVHSRIGWKAKVSLAEGLQKTAEWIRGRRDTTMGA